MRLGLGLGIDAGGILLKLLEQFPGAVAAYSLYDLSLETTNVVRVRRSSDNVEADFTAAEYLNGTLTTWTGANDGFVVTYYSQTGNNNATQSTASQQPKIVSGGSLITSNGYNVIQYDGTNDNLGIASLTATGTMLMSGSDGSAFYEVDINGAYNLLADPNNTDHPLNETIRVIWNRTLSASEKAAIESIVNYTDWDFSDITSFGSYWRDRSELTQFPLIDTSSGTTFTAAWQNCSSLTSFPLIDTSSGTTFDYAFFGCSSLTSFPLIDTSSGTNFNQTWRSCSSLTSFPLINTSSGTNFNQTWRSCSSLTSFPLINTSSGTNFSLAWFSCSSLTSFPLIDTSSGTIFNQTWLNCSSLTTISANMFDTCPATNFTNAFANTNLTSQSIENIVVSIDTAGQSNGTLDITGGGNATTATAQTAIDNLRGKGWTVTVPDGY